MGSYLGPRCNHPETSWAGDGAWDMVKLSSTGFDLVGGASRCKIGQRTSNMVLVVSEGSNMASFVR